MKKLKQNIATALCVSLVVNAATPVLGSQTDGMTDPLAGGVETAKKKSVKQTATPSDAELNDEEDEYDEEVDLIDDREDKPSLATDSNAEEDELEEDEIELATDSDAEEIELATDSNAAEIPLTQDMLTIQLTFDANGGEFGMMETSRNYSITLPSGMTPPRLEKRSGYKMTGWYTEPSGGKKICDETDMWVVFTEELLDGETTLYAHWEESSYTVTFKNGDTVLKTVKVKDGETVENPGNFGMYDDSSDECIKGWTTNNWSSDDFYDFSRPVTRDLILYAQIGMREDLSNMVVYLEQTKYSYTGKPIEPEVSSVYESYWGGSAKLQEGEDYVVEYENNINAGTGTVIIRGINKYKGFCRKDFTIDKAYLLDADIIFNDGSKGVYTFTGKKIHPDITVVYGDVILKEGVDYKLSDEWPDKIGSYSIWLYGIGNFVYNKQINIEILGEEVPDERSAEVKSLGYGRKLYMHVGEKFDFIEAEPASAVAGIRYDGSTVDTSLFSINEDGTIQALKEGQTYFTPVVYWKDGKSTRLESISLHVVPASEKIVTIKTILNEGTFYDGTTEESYVLASNEDTSMKSINIPDGKIFQGWYTENGTKVVNGNYLRNPDRDMTLYGKFAKKITIHFDFGEGTVKNESYKIEEIAEGDSTWLRTGDVSYACEREGYLIAGWCLDPECKGEVFTGNYIPKLAENQNEITLYAKWEHSYQIEFDSGDGYFTSGANKNSISVGEGKTIGNKMPSDPVSMNGTFGGWFTEDGTRVTKSYVPTENIKVYAHWLTNNTYRVTFHANGKYFRDGEKTDAGDPTTATRQVQAGYPASISVYQSNYDCLWYRDSDFTIPYNMKAAVTEDLDLYARWVRRLQIIWDADGGTNTSGKTSGTTSFYEGGACNLPTVTKKGYRFDGWYTEDGQLITKQMHLTKNLSVKARWTPAQVHVILDLDGGTLPQYYMETEFYVNSGDKLRSVVNGTPQKDGAAFLGWFAEDGTRYDTLYWVPVTGEQTELKLTARWTTDYITVTFNAEDGSIFDEFSREYTNHLSYRIPKNQTWPKWLYEESFDEVGDRTVKGWNIVKGSTEAMNLKEMVFEKDIVLYPVWSAYWRISFDYMGGFYYTNSTNQGSWVVARGQELTSPSSNTMNRPGYKFAGWYETPDYTGEKFDLPFIPERNMMLYARWVNENAQIHTVTFNTDAQDTEGKTFTREVSDGDCVVKPADPQKDGVIFDGWYVNKECTVAYDFASPVYGDLTLYAKWTETKNVEDAAITCAEVTYNGKKQEPEVIVKLGSRTLVKDQDYTVEYPDVPENTNAGTGYVLIKGINDFEGTVRKEFKIKKAIYEIEPQVTSVQAVYGQKLADIDLSAAGEGWSWENAQLNVGNVGSNTFKIIYKAKDDNHEDKEAIILVMVAGVEITDDNTTLSLKQNEDIHYDGSEKEPEIVVVLNGKTLTKGKDYKIEYKDNVNAGTATYVIIGINNYSGITRGTFEILKAAASAADFGIANQVYEGIYDGKLSEVSPSLPEHWSWADPDTVLDTVTGNTSVTFPANFTTYEGCNFASAENVPLKVRIAPRTILDHEIEVDRRIVYYTGSECTVPIRVITNGRLLKENQDYTVRYQNNVNVGTATLIVEGKGNYTGTAKATFQIITDPYDLRGAQIVLNPMVASYTGEEIEPEVTVLMQNAETGKTDTLTQDTDYTVSFANNINPGTATVTVTGKGRYHDAKMENFFIEADNFEITATYGDTFKEIASKLPKGWSWKDPDAYVGDVTGKEGKLVEAVYQADGEEKTGNFRLIVEAKTLRKEMVKINGENISYHPEVEANKAEVVVRDPELNQVLVENVDYEVKYSGYEQVSDEGVSVSVIGIGNYKGTVSDEYTLAKADPKVELKSDKINAEHVMKLTALDEPFFLYTTFAGNGTVTYTSSNESVFTVETKDNKIGNTRDGYITVTGVGEATLTVKLSGDPNYEDQELVIPVQVEAVELQDSNVVLGQNVYQYCGSKIEPNIAVNYAGNVLTEGTDYTVSYGENTNAGEGSVTVTGLHKFSGTVVKTFTIEKAENPIAAPIETFEAVYGQKLNRIALPNGWTWDKPEETVGAVGIHHYAITLAETENYVAKHAEVEVVVSAKELTEDMVQLSSEKLEYTGSEIEPKVTVLDGSLLQSSDYTISYFNNVEVGDQAKVIVTATEGGNYAGRVTKTFTITRASLTEDAVKISGAYTYDGTQQKPEVTVIVHGRELEAHKDYEIAYGENIHAGNGAGSVTINGIGNYAGELTVTFDIAKAENPVEIPELAFTAVYGQKLETLELPDGWFWRASDATVGDAGENRIEIYLPETEDYLEKVAYAKVSVARKEKQDDMLKADLSDIIFTGNEVKPEISLTDGAYVLKENVDYTISYRNNLHAGTATMIITLIGNYSGTIEKEFTIEQSEANIIVGSGTTITHMLQSGSFVLDATVSGNGELQYTSTNPEVATVDEDGVVTPVGAGTTVITVIFMGDRDYKPAAVSVELTITKASTDHSSSDRSDSSSSKDSGSGTTTSGAGQMMTYRGVSIPSYVNVVNQWKQIEDGTWTLVGVNGEAIRDQWMAVYNPYADVAHGQEAYDWYRFDNHGKMLTGWYVDEKGDTYYLNPSTDNTQGGMKTGWVEIEGKWYYFNNQSDGTRGKLLKNATTPDGYHVQEDGSWDGNSNK